MDSILRDNGLSIMAEMNDIVQNEQKTQSIMNLFLRISNVPIEIVFNEFKQMIENLFSIKSDHKFIKSNSNTYDVYIACKNEAINIYKQFKNLEINDTLVNIDLWVYHVMKIINSNNILAKEYKLKYNPSLDKYNYLDKEKTRLFVMNKNHELENKNSLQGDISLQDDEIILQKLYDSLHNKQPDSVKNKDKPDNTVSAKIESKANNKTEVQIDSVTETKNKQSIQIGGYRKGYRSSYKRH